MTPAELWANLIWACTGAVLTLFIKGLVDLWHARHAGKRFMRALSVLAGYLHRKTTRESVSFNLSASKRRLFHDAQVRTKR